MPFIQASIGPTPDGTTLAGKTVIVTGANSGLGLEAARQYLVLGATRLILAVRSTRKGEDAAKYLSSHPTVQNANPHAQIKVMQLDLDDINNVHAFAQKVCEELDALHLLLLNGGVNITNYQTSTTGHERVMQVNYHSNALLALLLLSLLESTATLQAQPSRLTFVGSVGMAMHTLKKNPLAVDETVARRYDDKAKYAGFQRYSDSKLMVAAFTQELAQHVSSDKVIVNNVCPGMVATDLDQNLALWLKSFISIVKKLRARNVEVGARTYVWAINVVGKESHGCFIANNKIT
ncbi:MAG: hypothetical protein Q9181_005996, partial [Wetmoreana brouardii]